MQEPREVWGEVWYEIQRAVSRYGSYHDAETIEWSSASVAELVRLKGWLYLCTTTDPQSVVEAQARQTWEELRERRIRDKSYAPIGAATARRIGVPKLTDS
jgi:hypothetical protein